MPQSLSAVYVQIVFSTKNRAPLLVDETIRLKLFAGLAAISRRLDCPTLAVGGVADHVHILARQSRNVSMANWVRDLKRLSTPWLRQRNESLQGFAWQAGYGSFSVDPNGIEAARFYVEHQEQHHRKESFEEELLRLLSTTDLEWDRQYLFD